MMNIVAIMLTPNAISLWHKAHAFMLWRNFIYTYIGSKILFVVYEHVQILEVEDKWVSTNYSKLVSFDVNNRVLIKSMKP